MYSLDFRKRVLAIKKKEKLTFEATSKRFDIGIRTLFRWANRLEPYTTRNKPATKIDMERLKRDVQENPDRYQYERARMFQVTARGIGKALQRLSITYKKNSVASQARRSNARTV